MSTNKKIKTDNNNKIFQDIIDFEILRSIINYLLISKKNKNNNIINNNKSNTSDIYKINRFYYNRNEILNYILVSKKCYNFISLTISNNIINNKSFENWLKINNNNNNNNKSFIEYYNNQNQYDKNNLFFNYKKDKQNKISFNKEFSIIKIHESIINDYFKFNLFLDHITIDDFKEIKNKFENNQLLYNRIVVDVDTDGANDSNLFEIREDRETVKIFKILKGKNIIYDGSDIDNRKHANYSALFDPDYSGQQVESIKILSEDGSDEFIEMFDLLKFYKFENLHSISIPINSFEILSRFSFGMGFIISPMSPVIPICSLIRSKSLKNLNIISSVKSTDYPLNYEEYYDVFYDDLEILANDINKNKEFYSICFLPLFSEFNTSIERIEFDCCGLLNINTFSNLLNNKSIKYLYLYGNSDFIVYSKPNVDDDGGSLLHEETISINQYLFDNIFSSPLTSIRHYKIKFKESNQLKFIFNLILNNIFKLQLYSLIFVFNPNGNELIDEFIKEFKNLINNISTQQQQQEQQKPNGINLKEINININIKDDEYIQELSK
ncbi:hypothetical protein ACTFIW_011040 [Dictyostelium discoideum]